MSYDLQLLTLVIEKCLFYEYYRTLCKKVNGIFIDTPLL